MLVLGASGGVGSTAVGALANAGYEVHAATGKAGEHEFLRGLGAAEILGRDEVTADAERPLEKQRWAATVDPVGGAATAFALRTTKYGGAVAVCGLTAGTALNTTVLPFILRGVSLLGIDSVAAGADAAARRCGRAWPATCARAASTTRSCARSTSTGSSPSSTRCSPARRSAGPSCAYPTEAGSQAPAPPEGRSVLVVVAPPSTETISPVM